MTIKIFISDNFYYSTISYYSQNYNFTVQVDKYSCYFLMNLLYVPTKTFYFPNYIQKNFTSSSSLGYIISDYRYLRFYLAINNITYKHIDYYCENIYTIGIMFKFLIIKKHIKDVYKIKTKTYKSININSIKHLLEQTNYRLINYKI